ncbi:MAG: DUF2148 domain-containing protein [Candidatus Omnitrophica bacterium]|nr:DUF2148 domain-containing protein [Candidatus Omnitrophota bacterium]
MRNSQVEKNALIQIAGFMAAAARTAPKAKGIDNIKILIISTEKEKLKLINAMNEAAGKHDKPGFKRDAQNLKHTGAILFIGTKAVPIGLTYCGFCGYKDCASLIKAKGICAYNSIDLGIAAGSAVSIAGDFKIDNRIMYSAGKAALNINLFKDKAVKAALAIPLSATGKNVFFDRK